MKIAFVGCIAGILLLGSVSISRADSSADTEKVITALEMKWTKAQQDNNPDMAAPLLADKLVMTGVDGKLMNRTEFLAGEKSTQYSNVSIDDLKVAVFGNTAIATYSFSTKGTDKDGAFERHSRDTDTWVKMPSGKWQVVASHGSTIK